MKNTPFTVYDFIAYLSSGATVVAALDYSLGQGWLLGADHDIATGILVLLAAYIAGHIIGHVSQLLLEAGLAARLLGRPVTHLMSRKPTTRWRFLFPNYFRPLPAETRANICRVAETDSVPPCGEPLFLHAYGLLRRNPHMQDRLDKFRNLYGFARNMCLALLIASVALFSSGPDTTLVAWLALGASVVMLYRYLKFFRHFSYRLLISYSTRLSPE